MEEEGDAVNVHHRTFAGTITMIALMDLSLSVDNVVAAIALTLRERKDSKAIDPSIQVRVKARDRVSLVQVPVTQSAPAVQDTPAQEKQA